MLNVVWLRAIVATVGVSEFMSENRRGVGVCEGGVYPDGVRVMVVKAEVVHVRAFHSDFECGRVFQ